MLFEPPEILCRTVDYADCCCRALTALQKHTALFLAFAVNTRHILSVFSSSLIGTRGDTPWINTSAMTPSASVSVSVL